MNLRVFLFSLSLIALFGGCRPDDLVEEDYNPNYPDWTEATHGNSVPPNYDITFNQNKVSQFEISITAANWTLMQENIQDYIAGGMEDDFEAVWVPCGVCFDNINWYEVGICYKGKSSFDDYETGQRKISFKLDFDEFEEEFPYLNNQRFYGFKQLNLLNNEKDNSLMREKVAADLFRQFGVPAAQTAFYTLSIDFGEGSTYFGVYTLVEEIDDTALEEQFEEDYGNIYKPSGLGSTFAQNSYNELDMGKKNNDISPDYSDVFSLYTTLNSTLRETDYDQWKSDLESEFDVQLFLKWLAANSVMQNADSYGNKQGNYYLYNYALTHQLCWIPYDLNKAMKSKNALELSLSSVGDNWPLIRYVLDDADYYQTYKTYVSEFSETVFSANKMSETYITYYQLLKDYAYAETAPYTYLDNSSDFDFAVEDLKTQALEREIAVSLFLE